MSKYKISKRVALFYLLIQITFYYVICEDLGIKMLNCQKKKKNSGDRRASTLTLTRRHRCFDGDGLLFAGIFAVWTTRKRVDKSITYSLFGGDLHKISKQDGRLPSPVGGFENFSPIPLVQIPTIYILVLSMFHSRF